MVKSKAMVMLFLFSMNGAIVLAEPTLADLPDITQGVIPVVQYKHAQPLSGEDLTSVSEVEFIVRVKNQTGDPLVADSLILIVDSVKELTGAEILDRVKIESPDGLMPNGKPYFRIPNEDEELGPFGESRALTIRVTNPDYLRFYPPNFRVRGLRRSPGNAVKGLLDSLVQKGILAPEEAANALKSATPPVVSENP